MESSGLSLAPTTSALRWVRYRPAAPLRRISALLILPVVVRDVEFVGETEDEIMQKASDHAKREHNLPVIPPNIEDKCRGAICEVEDDVGSTGGNNDGDNNDDDDDEGDDEEKGG